MQPTIGRIVHYTLTEQDAEAINRRRADFADSLPANTGFQAHVGNHAEAGQTFPAEVVRTFGGSAVNLQVRLDGSDTYWATSRTEGEPDKQGCWIWPPRT
ncbi:hypothetical protein [Micromonospora rubida]